MSEQPFRDHVQQIADGEVSDPRLSVDEARAILTFADERLAEGIAALAGIYADGGFNLQDFLADRHGEDGQP